MKKKVDLEEDIEMRDEEDDSAGDEIVKKKEKKGKSKEQKLKDRRVVFWTLIFILLITLVFWLLPVIRKEKPLFEDAGFAEQGTKEKSFVKYQL